MLAAIRKNWREHPETREEVEAKDAYWVFDTFVKTELRKVLLKSKASYATYAMTAFSQQFALFFGSQLAVSRRRALRRRLGQNHCDF